MTPSIPNSYNFLWTLMNLLLPLIGLFILAFIVWYLKKRIYYQEHLLKTMNRLVFLLEDKKIKKD